MFADRHAGDRRARQQIEALNGRVADDQTPSGAAGERDLQGQRGGEVCSTESLFSTTGIGNAQDAVLRRRGR